MTSAWNETHHRTLNTGLLGMSPNALGIGSLTQYGRFSVVGVRRCLDQRKGLLFPEQEAGRGLFATEYTTSAREEPHTCKPHVAFDKLVSFGMGDVSSMGTAGSNGSMITRHAAIDSTFFEVWF